MKRHALIAGNWKMNGFEAEANALAAAINAHAASCTAELAVCPPYVHICTVRDALAHGAVGLGGQDLSVRDNGAYTGEISADMLVDMGCKYVIVGHSERRQYHEEDNALVRVKAEKALGAGLMPIICVGETLAEREGGQTAQVITAQIEACVPACATGEDVVIAYEPVWAIGTGLSANNAQIAEVHGLIRSLLENKLAQGEKLRILYGGSVKPENAEDILGLEDVDGALVGGAALKADSFLAIATAVKG